MAGHNEIAIDHETNQYWCFPCDRLFVNERALLQHCRQATVHRGKWCERCRYLFESPEARSLLIEKSPRHWLCFICTKYDFFTHGDCVEHLAEQHSYCNDCQEVVFSYFEHRCEEHHRCRRCNREFSNSNALRMHMQIHLFRNIECYGCYRLFASISGMFIHLEAGNCGCQINYQDIDEWAEDCESQMDILAGRYYECPGCDSSFGRLSGLLQHLEADVCHGDHNGDVEWMTSVIAERINDMLPRH